MNEQIVNLFAKAQLSATGESMAVNDYTVVTDSILLEEAMKHFLIALGYRDMDAFVDCNGGDNKRCDKCRLTIESSDMCLPSILEELTTSLFSAEYYVKTKSTGDIVFGPATEDACYKMSRNLRGVEVVGHI